MDGSFFALGALFVAGGPLLLAVVVQLQRFAVATVAARAHLERTAPGFVLGLALAGAATAPSASIAVPAVPSAVRGPLPLLDRAPLLSPPNPEPVAPDRGAATDLDRRAPREGAAAQAIHVVRPGESLWSITARCLGPSASAADIARTWPQLWHANRDAIGPHPDVLLPGQQLRLPPVLANQQ